MPRRIQRKRTKGSRTPPGVVYCGRPSRFGNPHRIGFCPVCGVEHTAEEAVAEYEAELDAGTPWAFQTLAAISGLRGKDLSDWCALDAPCHVDVILKIANQPLKG